jgi:hypothetical protein
MSQCDECPAFDDCPILEEYVPQIRQAIAELTEELDLASVIQRT